MAEMDCARLREVGAEFALGVLPTVDRAAALSHLRTCAACERYVQELAALGDRLTGLPTGVEPPLGFDGRVMRRLGFRPRRRWLAAAAVVVAVLFGAGGWVLHGLVHDDLTKTTIIADGNQVGDVFTYTDDGPPWVYVALTDLPQSGTMHCQLIFANGRLLDVGSFLIEAGSGGWGGPAPLTESDLVEVRILAEDGALLGVGRMP
jgi:hypothetical protein